MTHDDIVRPQAAASAPIGSGLTTYSRTAMALHWAIAVLAIATLPLGLIGATFEDAGQWATDIHKPIGILILVLTLVRIGWRLTHRPPALAANPSAALRWIAKATHVLFYVLLVVLPLSGWWMSSAVPMERHPIAGGLIPFLPVPRGWASAGPAHMIHTNLAFLMIGLIVLHIAAALKHQFLDRDDTLARMLPPGA